MTVRQQKAARNWWRSEWRRQEGHDTRTGPYTVADAITDYLKALTRRGSKGVHGTRQKADVQPRSMQPRARCGWTSAVCGRSGAAVATLSSTRRRPTPTPAVGSKTPRHWTFTKQRMASFPGLVQLTQDGDEEGVLPDAPAYPRGAAPHEFVSKAERGIFSEELGILRPAQFEFGILMSKKRSREIFGLK